MVVFLLLNLLYLMWLFFPLSTPIPAFWTGLWTLSVYTQSTQGFYSRILLDVKIQCECWLFLTHLLENIVLHWHSGSHRPRPCRIWEAIALEPHAEFLFHSNSLASVKADFPSANFLLLLQIKQVSEWPCVIWRTCLWLKPHMTFSLT